MASDTSSPSAPLDPLSAGPMVLPCWRLMLAYTRSARATTDSTKAAYRSTMSGQRYRAST